MSGTSVESQPGRANVDEDVLAAAGTHAPHLDIGVATHTDKYTGAAGKDIPVFESALSAKKKRTGKP